MSESPQKKAKQLLSEVRAFGEKTPLFPELLETFVPLGVRTKKQISRILRIPEAEAEKLLERVASFRGSEEAGSGAIIERVSLRERKFWTRPGAAPIMYRRGPGAAAYVRDVTGRDIRACEISTPDQLTHILCIGDCAIMMTDWGCEVKVEQQIGTGKGSIRLDVQVTLPDGILDVELEQSAGPDHIPRIRETLQARHSFIASPKGKQFVRWILIVFNVAQAEWPRIQRVWRQALATMNEEPCFRVYGVLLSQLEKGTGIDDRSVWIDLTDPVAIAQETATSKAIIVAAPAMLQRRQDFSGDIVVLAAFLQQFEEQVATDVTDFAAFCALIETVAGPSLWGHVDGSTGTELPRASLYLLGRYLEMHADLAELLRRRMMEGAELNRWSVTGVTTRLKGIARSFLGYFGLSPDGDLAVRVRLPDFNRDLDEIHITVHMRAPWPATDSTVRYIEIGAEEPGRFEQALAFVLHLILWYPERLGLRRPPYL